MKKTTRLMSLIIAAALILSGCNQNNVVSHQISDASSYETTTTATTTTTSVTTTEAEATTTTTADVSVTEETTPATTVSFEETTVPVDAGTEITEDTTTLAETTEIIAEQVPVETTTTTTTTAALTTAATTTTTARATTTETVVLAYTSAVVAGNPEPPHIYVIHVDKNGNEEYDWNSVWNDMGAGVFTQTIYAKELDQALENAFKYWEETYGNKYGRAVAKVIYYTGETIIYSRNGSAPATTTATTTTAKPAVTTTATTKASTTVSTTKAQTTAKTTAKTTATTTAPITTTTSSADTTISIPKPETFADDYKNKYMYKALNDAQKKWYEWHFLNDRYGITNGKEPKLSSEDEQVASLALEISCRITFDDEVIEKAKKIVSKALKENNSYDQLKAIHDGLCDIAEYGGNQSWGNLFRKGKGNCYAYADAFTYLCQLAGFDCVGVSGDVYNGTNWGGHEWNMVMVEGNWYYVDVTWDDGGWGTKWFLKGSETMNKDHKVSTSVAVSSIYPTASKTDYKA